MYDSVNGTVYPFAVYYNNGNPRVGINKGGSTVHYTLEVVGDAAKDTGTAWINTSDKRTKKNISPFTKGLETILNVNPVYF